MDTQEEKNHGISLFKIDYEIQGKENSVYSAGIVAETSEQAVKSLADFLAANITNFKGYKIDTLSFQGAVHHLSDPVRKMIVGSAKAMEESVKTPKKKSVLKKG
jgi:hypothetical protein